MYLQICDGVNPVIKQLPSSRFIVEACPSLLMAGSRLLSSLEHCQASQGAACHSYTISRPSPILLAIGIPAEVAANALRVSIGRDTTREDIDVFVQDLKNAIGKLQS